MIKTRAKLAIELSHKLAGDEGVCGLKLRRSHRAAEKASFHVSLQAHTQKTMYQMFQAGALYEHATSMLAIGALRPGDIAIDIGAHVGYFSLLFRLLVGRTGAVYAFEPMPDTYLRLVRNIMRNNFTNVIPLPLAVAERSGTAEFCINSENEGGSTLLPIVVNDEHDRVQVQVTSLDNVFVTALPSRPRLLKIDAEGVEMLILKGGRQWFLAQAPDMLICEINRGALDAAGTSESEIRAHMESLGYRSAVIIMRNMDGKINPHGASFYQYLQPEAEAAPGFPYVFNMMFVRKDSDLYPDPYL